MVMSRSRQDGYILLALLLVVFVTGSSLLLGSLNNRQQIANNQHTETLYQLLKAKEALLSFATNSATIFSNVSTRGPGYFPCPDTDGTDTNSEPSEPCNSNSPLVGRLPNFVEVD